jgi:hypothetical protein
MNVVTIVSCDAKHNLTVRAAATWPLALTRLWLDGVVLDAETVDKLRCGEIVPTADGWVLVQETHVDGLDAPTPKPTPTLNHETAVKALRQLGFVQAKAEAAVDEAEKLVGVQDLDKLVTEALRQSA